jgi:enamine deaminase RidA (YjgF/YER057c/UK114 family)
MSKIRLLLAAVVILGLSAAALRAAQPPTGQAAANLDVLVDAIRSNRKALVAVNLKLTDEEATKFWPVYDRYQQEINAVGDRLVGVIQDYTANFSNLSNDKAMKLVDDYLAVEADRVKVKRAYVDEFTKALPGRKVVRFYQIENKMDAVIRYDLAAAIPVMEEEKGVSAK